MDRHFDKIPSALLNCYSDISSCDNFTHMINNSDFILVFIASHLCHRKAKSSYFSTHFIFLRKRSIFKLY